MVELDPKVQIGKILGEARSKAGLSQDALAAKMQAAGLPISSSKLAAIESGKSLPNTESARVLEGILGIDLRRFGLPQPRTHVLPEPPDREFAQVPTPPSFAPGPHPTPGEDSTVGTAVSEEPGRGKVGEYPRVTLYLDPGTKCLLDAASTVLGIPAYRLLTQSFLEHFRTLPEADRSLIERVAQQRGSRTNPSTGRVR